MLFYILLALWIGGIVWFVKSVGGLPAIDEWGNEITNADRKHLERMMYTYH